jgi:hypothetical protein
MYSTFASKVNNYSAGKNLASAKSSFYRILPVERLLIQLNAFHALNPFKYKYVVVVLCDAVQTRRYKLHFPKHWHLPSLHGVTTQNNVSSSPP